MLSCRPVCTPLDFEEMRNTDCVLAFPGAPISGGMHIELGWASAMKKKISIFVKKGEQYSPLILGLHEITESKVFYFQSFDELDELMTKRISDDSAAEPTKI